MAARRPLVRINGRTRQLPAGELLAGIGKLPFFTSSGNRSDIPLTASGALPFFKSDGTASAIPLAA